MINLNIWLNTKILLKFQFILILLIFLFSSLKGQQQKHLPSIKLVEPIARLLENGPVTQRLPETTCPTPSTEKDPITNIFSGIQFSVSWNDPGHLPVELAKLELFSSDSAGHLLSRLDLINEKKGEENRNSSISTVKVLIPEGLRCTVCILRLSLELDEKVQLISCAQVSVKPAEKERKEEEEEEGEECLKDENCLFGGSCVNKSCFCLNGRFGQNCKNENPFPTSFSSKNQNSDLFQSINFPESEVEFKWLANPNKNIINFGLSFNEEIKEKWFILGLQSTEKDLNCKLALEQWKKQKQNKIKAKAGGSPLIKVEQEKGENALNIDITEEQVKSTNLTIRKLNEGKINVSESEKILKGANIQECDTNQRWEQCPDSERECEPSCEWTAFPESIPLCPARTSEQKCGKPRCVCVEGFVRLGKNLNECKPFSFCQAPEAIGVWTEEPKNEKKEKQQPQQLCPKNEIWEKCGNTCEPTCKSMYSEEPCSSVCGMPGCTCSDNFVRLSVGGPCIEWTECPNLKERNEPKNISTVKPTQGRLQCGANETINECGTVCEADCLSIFEREECHNCGKPSCACRQGFARLNGKCIYWGDCPAVNSFTSTTPTDTKNKKLTKEFKHSGEINTKTTPDKITTGEPPMNICTGEWKWPKGCEEGEKKCHYSIEWFFDSNTDSIQFTLETIPAIYKKLQNNLNQPIWSGLGFSPSGTLLDADMIIIKINNNNEDKELNEIGKLEIIDMHVDEKLEQFRPDDQQNVILHEGIFNYTSGLFKAKFSRKRRTGDSNGEDLDFSEENENCVRFLFPISGGRFEKSGNISVPVADSLYASDTEICAYPCGDKNSNEIQSNIQTKHSCIKEFKWPLNCKLENCEYRANWEWEGKDDTVIFNISSRGIGRWTGIGFSKDGKMTGSDIITGWFYDQKPYLTDRFAFAQQQPAIDPADRQDIFDIGGALNDDIQTISFRRKVVSLDKSTDLSLAQCVHFLFPVQGGRVLARSSKDFQQSRTPIGFHDQQQPISSTSRICLCDRPINFKNSENEKMGRRQIREVLNDKNREEEENEKVNNELPPYQCADVTIIQVMENHKNQKNLLIRAIDAFGLSNDSLKEDEHWGGKQSFIEVELVNNNGKNIIWLTKLLKDPINSKGDLSIQQGQIQVFLSTGHGIKPEISKSEKLEFALIDLMASSLQKEIIETSSLTNLNTSLSIPTTLEIKNITEQIEIISSSSDSPLQQKVKEASSEMENSEEKEEGEKEELEQYNEGNKEEENEEEETSQLPSDISKTSILTDENCFGGFAYPEDCMQLNSKQCQYMLQWMVIPELFKVNFQLNIQMPANHWTGIGFSKDGSMVNSDSIIAILEKDGKITVQDRFSINYEKPLLDSKQNIEQINFNSIDGFWALNFSRSLFTNDVQDADLRLCQHFIFLNFPNPLNNGEIKKHIKTPKISENLICLGKCGQKTSSTQGDVLIEELTTTTTMLETTLETLKEIEKQTEITQTLILETTTERETTEKTLETTQTLEKEKETTTEKETKEEEITEKITTTNTISSTTLTTNKDEEQIKNNLIEESLIIKNEQKYKKKIFNVAIKLPNEEWNNKLGETDSEEFNLMAEKLRNSLSSLISIKWPSLEMINVQKFAEGSVLALLQITFNTTIKNIEDLPTSKQLKHFLKEAAAQKMPAELILDSEMLEVQENEEEEGGGFNDNNEIGGEEKEKIASIGQWQGWILAILGTFLLLSIATALLFCAFRNRKYQQHQTYPTKHNSSLNRHNKNNLRGNNLFFNGQISTNNNYQQSNHQHYTPFPGEKEDRQSENSTSNKTNNSECCNNNVKIQNKIIETPRGIGEASYREWFKKVASKDTPTHYQENYWQIPPPTPLPRSNNHGGLGGLGGGGQQTPTIYGHSASPYLSYPNDPTYYTLNGEHKIVPPPPAYYRPF